MTFGVNLGILSSTTGGEIDDSYQPILKPGEKFYKFYNNPIGDTVDGYDTIDNTGPLLYNSLSWGTVLPQIIGSGTIWGYTAYYSNGETIGEFKHYLVPHPEADVFNIDNGGILDHFTVQAAFKLNSGSSQARYGLINKTDNAGGGARWQIRIIYANPNYVAQSLIFSSTGGYTLNTGTIQFAQNQSVTVQLVCNKSANNITQYINGSVDKIKTISAPSSSYSNNLPFNIGSEDNIYVFNGEIYWTSFIPGLALTPAEFHLHP
jgi:hypothetical protein